MVPNFKPQITLEDLRKIDIRVGRIQRVSDMPVSDQLMKLEVDFGGVQRVVVAGIKKERANAREIEGMQALFVGGSQKPFWSIQKYLVDHNRTIIVVCFRTAEVAELLRLFPILVSNFRIADYYRPTL
jgi:Putative tRNA binding domain